MLLASFFADYGIILIILLVCAAMMIFYFIKNRRQTDELEKFESSLKPGDKVKTYSGFYGEVAGVELIKENGEQVRVITLKLANNTLIEVDARAIAQLDVRTKEEEDTLESKVAELRKKEDLAKQDQSRANAVPPAKQTVVAPNAQTAAKPVQNAPAKPVADVKATPVSQAKPEQKAEKPAEAKPETKPVTSPAKPEAKPASQVGAKVEQKPAPASKPEAKPNQASTAQSASAKPAQNAPAKPVADAKATPVSQAKPEQKAEKPANSRLAEKNKGNSGSKK